jgi:hypothetical protein
LECAFIRISLFGASVVSFMGVIRNGRVPIVESQPLNSLVRFVVACAYRNQIVRRYRIARNG